MIVLIRSEEFNLKWILELPVDEAMHGLRMQFLVKLKSRWIEESLEAKNFDCR